MKKLIIFAIIMISTVVSARDIGRMDKETKSVVKGLLKSKNYKTAKVLLDAWVEGRSFTTYPDAYYMLGYCREKQGNRAGAAEMYKKAILRNVALKGKDADYAAKALTRLVDMYPHLAVVLEASTTIGIEAGKYKGMKANQLRLLSSIFITSAVSPRALAQIDAENIPKVTNPPNVSVIVEPVTEKTMEKALGYDLKWAPRDAVEGPNGHKYKYFDKKVTWEQAQSICQKLGGHLVTVTSAEENKFVTDLITVPVWLGVDAKEKNWKNWGWITGETMGYTNWCEAQPEGPRHIALNPSTNTHPSYLTKWGYTPTPRGFICEWVK